MAALQHRQLKEALFLKKLHQDKRENAVHSRWLVRLGKDPVSEQSKRQMLEQREMDLNEYTAKRADGRKEGVFAAGSPMLSCRRVLREAGQPPGGAPAFRMHPSGHLALRCRVLRVFQQAARRVVIACRMKQRLVHLRKLTQEPKNEKAEDGQKTCDAKISPGKVLSFSFPVLPEEGNRWVPGDFAVVPTCPFGATENTHTPFLKLQVPQHYQLMGYRPVSAWEAYNTYVPPTLARPLHTGPLDEWSPLGIRSLSSGCAEAQAEDPEATTSPVLTFTAPEALLRPAPANPVRVFNPAPDLQTYKPTPKYLESDANYHLCPLPRYPVPKSSPSDIKTPDTQESSLDLKEVMKGFMEIPNLSSFKHQSNLSSLTDDLTPRRCARYNTDILPERAPPPLSRLPDDMRALSGQLPGPQGAQLTPEMIRAVFLDDEVLLSKLNRGLSSGGCGVEELYWLQLNQAGERVAGRLKQLEEESRGTSVSSVGK